MRFFSISNSMNVLSRRGLSFKFVYLRIPLDPTHVLYETDLINCLQGRVKNSTKAETCLPLRNADPFRILLSLSLRYFCAEPDTVTRKLSTQV